MSKPDQDALLSLLRHAYTARDLRLTCVTTPTDLLIHVVAQALGAQGEITGRMLTQPARDYLSAAFTNNGGARFNVLAIFPNAAHELNRQAAHELLTFGLLEACPEEHYRITGWGRDLALALRRSQQ